MSSFITNKEQLSFREITLGHLKKILELSCSEFRGGYHKIIHHQGGSTKEYVPDGRRVYIQAVENFAMILFPHFDNIMEKEFIVYGKKSDELRKIVEKQVEEIELNKNHSKNELIKWNVIEKKLVHAHILFKQLNLLLKRVDYLKKSIYEEHLEELEQDDKESS